MNQLIDADDRILYLCDIYRNMTEGGCDGTMCMFGGMFGGDCKHTMKREFSRNYKGHEPTDEELFERFEDVGYAWVENEPIYADQYYIVRWNYEL